MNIVVIVIRILVKLEPVVYSMQTYGASHACMHEAIQCTVLLQCFASEKPL